MISAEMGCIAIKKLFKGDDATKKRRRGTIPKRQGRNEEATEENESEAGTSTGHGLSIILVTRACT